MCIFRYTTNVDFSLVTEQNGNVRRPSVWNSLRRPAITPPSKDYTEHPHMAAGTHLNPAPVRRPQALPTFITDRPLLQPL